MDALAADTESHATRGATTGEPSWRALIRRIASGELAITEEDIVYYLIHRVYAGPNHDQHELDAEQLIVQCEPGRTNMTHEPRIDGWLGTTNDWAEYARGEFVSADELVAYAAEHWPGVDESALRDAITAADRERDEEYPDWPRALLPVVETGDPVDIPTRE